MNKHLIDQIFRQARSQNSWLDEPVADDELMALYDLMKLCPTSMNCAPARLLFVRTPQAKAKLVPLMSMGNWEKTARAPVAVIIGQDLAFYERLPQLFPFRPEAREIYAAPGKEALAEATAFRNSSLQGAYLILAARARGLDCAPMSGFDAAAVDQEFWPDCRVRTNFICGIGHGDPAGVRERLPRLSFEEACQLL